MKIIFFSLLTFFSFNTFSNTTLLSEFGEKEKLVKVVDDMFSYVLLDNRIKASFEKLDLVKTKSHLVDFLCVTMDGSCQYTGQNMKRAHKGHEISTAHFYALTEALQMAMEKNSIPQRAQNKLIARLAPMQKDIINN